MTQGAVEAFDLACEVRDLADLLAVLMASPDAEGASNGARLVALEISNRAEAIKKELKG